MTAVHYELRQLYSLHYTSKLAATSVFSPELEQWFEFQTRLAPFVLCHLTYTLLQRVPELFTQPAIDALLIGPDPSHIKSESAVKRLLITKTVQPSQA